MRRRSLVGFAWRPASARRQTCAGGRAATGQAPATSADEALQTGADVVAETDPQHGLAARPERGEVAARLGTLEHAERVGLPGHRHVVGVVPDDLQEQTARGAALVELPGGVQVARTVAERRRDAQAVAQREAKALQASPTRPGRA